MPQELRSIERIILTACGTVCYAAMVGEYLIEELAGIPVEVEYASEFRYRNPLITDKTLVFAITQSGETADTLAALREAKQKGATVLGICNVVGSTIAREADGGIYLHAGPEIGVASTKAFTSQVAVLTLLALFLGRMRAPQPDEGMKICKALDKHPGPDRAKSSSSTTQIRDIAKKYNDARQLPLTWAALQLPDGPGRRAQAQGNQLHPRRRLSRGRDEARPDRPDRREHAQRVHRPHAAPCTTR